MSCIEKLRPRLVFVLALSLIGFFAGCTVEIDDVISLEEAQVLMDRYMDTLNESDMALIDEIISPDFTLRSPMFPEPIVGIEGYKALVSNTAATFSDFEAKIDEIAVSGDKIWGKFSMSGNNTGPLGDLPPTNRSFRITGLAVSRVADGMIVADETYWNVLDLYQQLGFTLMPPEAGAQN